MDYSKLLDIAMKLGYRLAMSGAETFRIEESIRRVMDAYSVPAEVFAIPNLLIINIETPDGQTFTRMRRISYHGNDLDSVERYNNLGRRICREVPSPDEAMSWLRETDASKRRYRLPVFLAGNFLGAFGFGIFFGGTLLDGLCAGICGIMVGLVSRLMDTIKINPFFSTIASAFILSLTAYTIGALGMSSHTDTLIIGTLMILVPGLLFTNAMRDIIFGDTNSGINRIVQVLLIAMAIAMGTGAAWALAGVIWGTPISSIVIAHPYWIQCIASFIGCVGFAILFNIHGPGGLLCALGGLITWATYCLTYHFSNNEILSNLIAATVAGIYSEIMARIRKYPAISYLCVSIFPLLPGAGIYYTTSYIVRGDMINFASTGTQTAAIAGALAVGILMVSTTMRFWNALKKK